MNFQIQTKFELNLKIIRIEKGKVTIHLGHIAAHDYRGSLGQAQLARPMARPLASPCQPMVASVRTMHGHLRSHGKSGHGGIGVKGLSRAENQNKARGNEPHTSAIMPLYDDLGGEAGKWCSPEGLTVWSKKMASTGRRRCSGRGCS
jgi:hypothetical protein